MFLLKCKVKGRSIKHPLGRIHETLTEERVIELVNELRNGNTSVVTEIVMGYTRLAISVAGKYAVLNPNKSHEFVSEAIIAIFEACYDVTKLRDNNLTGFIMTRMHKKIMKYNWNDRAVTMPESSYYESKKTLKLKQISMPQLTYNNNRMIELRDLIARATRTAQEREVIRLRELSLGDKEIGEMLSLSTSRVAQIRSTVYERFERLEKCL